MRESCSFSVVFTIRRNGGMVKGADLCNCEFLIDILRGHVPAVPNHYEVLQHPSNTVASRERACIRCVGNDEYGRDGTGYDGG